jgi:uncharacterized Ntn-hydrolase superfamily protein
MTYSIVARDPDTGQLGVACESYFFAPGASVTWAEPGVGAVATQAFVDGRYGRDGLALLGAGLTPSEALERLVGDDRHPEVRQVALVGVTGDAAMWTGGSCIASAGGIVDGAVSVQGNMLSNDRVLNEMLEAFHTASGDLADRILAAMTAAEAAGGDIRGSQGASLIVVDGEPTDQPWLHKPIDLRVEDHPDPIGELRRLLRQRRAFDAVSGAMFAPGLMVGPFREPHPGDLDRALDALAEAAEVLAGNPQAQFWSAVLRMRSGDIAAARSDIAAACALNPRMRAFLGRLPAAGFISDADVIELLA